MNALYKGAKENELSEGKPKKRSSPVSDEELFTRLLY